MPDTDPLVVDLDDQRCHDPAVAGAKAATLARARAQGFPVLDGVVVPSSAASPSLSAGAKALADSGSGGARLAVMGVDVSEVLVTELRRRIDRLGAPVVVRSSSRVEDSGDFAGAFSSFNGIGPDEVQTAVRGVWASPFSVDALERCEAAGVPVDDVALAVLIQPEVTPLFGGSAKVREDGAVAVVAIEGAPQKLMSGWDPGVTGVGRPGEAGSGDAVDLLGREVFDAVVDLAAAVHTSLGDNLIEWAFADTGVVLLQARKAAQSPAMAEPPPPLPVFREASALRIARTARRFPGTLGESLVLPWALATPTIPATSPVEPVDDLIGVLDEVRVLAQDLASAVWSLPAEAAVAAAAELCRDLRGPDPTGAVASLDELAPVDPVAAARAAWLIETLVASASRLGYVEHPSQVWDLTVERLEHVLEGTDAPSLGVRSAADRWEPFVYGVVAAQGAPVDGVPVADGVGAGRIVVVDDPEAAGDVHRAIIVARRPIPALSSLLWRAAGLVTVAGSPAAHLFEVATSVGVPAVINVDFEELFPGGVGDLRQREMLGAIDGTSGRVWLLEDGV